MSRSDSSGNGGGCLVSSWILRSAFFSWEQVVVYGQAMRFKRFDLFHWQTMEIVYYYYYFLKSKWHKKKRFIIDVMAEFNVKPIVFFLLTERKICTMFIPRYLTCQLAQEKKALSKEAQIRVGSSTSKHQGKVLRSCFLCGGCHFCVGTAVLAPVPCIFLGWTASLPGGMMKLVWCRAWSRGILSLPSGVAYVIVTLTVAVQNWLWSVFRFSLHSFMRV